MFWVAATSKMTAALAIAVAATPSFPGRVAREQRADPAEAERCRAARRSPRGRPVPGLASAKRWCSTPAGRSPGRSARRTRRRPRRAVDAARAGALEPLARPDEGTSGEDADNQDQVVRRVAAQRVVGRRVLGRLALAPTVDVVLAEEAPRDGRVVIHPDQLRLPRIHFRRLRVMRGPLGVIRRSAAVELGSPAPRDQGAQISLHRKIGAARSSNSL